ncbi:MAG: D-2-hydroxyacid dehydrogenase [Candidatus Bipolaricaulota bacterium]|nr:D-2-hydroxyacid dehydrogenase [Candidatus Bipolaricaulota bacterium]
MTFKVLVSDPLAKSAVAAMLDAGLVVDEKTDLSIGQLKSEIANYDAIVIRSATKLRAEVIDAAANLKLIVRAGVGMDNIDVDYAKGKGISVRNTPAASSNSVAELALGHLISLARCISRGTVSVKSGKWEKKALKGIEIEGKTLGIVGIGRIGQFLAQKAAALGMKVIAYDKFLDKSPLPEIVTMVEFEELLVASDFISLHIPFDPKVGATIGEAEISKMKDGVRLLNCARGGVIEEDALATALASGKVGGAALDVYTVEPPSAGNSLFAQENVSFTPHIGASTVEAQARVGAEAATTVIEFAKAQ